MLNWSKDINTYRLEAQIAQRAASLAAEVGVNYPIMDASMDIDACHSNGCPLDLRALLAANDGNFGHDVFGIKENIDRKTGQLQNCFWPRYAG